MDMVYLIYENVCMSAKSQYIWSVIEFIIFIQITQSFQKKIYTEIHQFPRQKAILNSKS